MNVGQLIRYLSTLPDDYIVVIAKDSEGNGYSPLDETSLEVTEQGEMSWEVELLDDGDGEKNTVVLWPVN